MHVTHHLASISKAVFLAACCLFSAGVWCDEIHEHGYWLINSGKEHAFDPLLAEALGTFLVNENAHKCVDFGAGKGEYVKAIRSKGISCDGYDGNPYSGSSISLWAAGSV